jgi:inner membrane protein
MRIYLKLAVIAALVLLLTIPLFLVVSKIYERDNYYKQARDDIARSWTGEQTVLGPLLVIPYTRVYDKREIDRVTNREVTQQMQAHENLFVLPDTFTASADLKTELRYRGIYEVPVYTGSILLHGRFSNAALIELAKRDDIVGIGQPFISVSVSDMRGIAETPTLQWDSGSIGFLPGSRLPFRAGGIHAVLDGVDVTGPASFRYSLSLTLRGMSSFHVVPVGTSSSVSMGSIWPHPRFEGLYLPSRRDVSGEGFAAEWQLTAFATNIAQKARDCASGSCAEFLGEQLGVALVDPVDVYLQAQRASKYGILFIGLTFAAFFLFEVLGRLAIHPVQYTLVGLALTVFYLLLVSLAEQIPFAWAYLIAAGACCGLLGFYISYVLDSIVRGSVFASAIAALYAILYVIIRQEDYAFSMGAILVFAALAVTMFVTRHIDWFAIGREARATGGPARL